MAPAFLSSWEVDWGSSNPRQGVGKVWLWAMAAIFQKEGWKVTMTFALVLLRS